MKTREVTRILKSLGWQAFTDEVGDKYTHYHLADRTVEIFYCIRKLKDEQSLKATLSLTTAAFSNACSAIDVGNGSYDPLIRAWNGIAIRATPEILEEHVRQASEQAIQWAKEQDLEKALDKHAAMPTDAPGAQPLWHLGALVVLGKVDRLKFYQSSFEKGDRLGFVDYITGDYIDRAVALAEQRVTNS